MCISDWRLGRLIRSVSTPFSTAAGTGLVYGRNPQRVGVTILMTTPDPGSGGAFTIAFDGGGAGALPAENAPHSFTLQSHGDLPTRAFVLAAGSAAGAGIVIEHFMPESYLQAGLDEFKRQNNIQ